jgi:hypothetical protein
LAAAGLADVFFVAGVVCVLAGFFIASAIESNQPAPYRDVQEADRKK